MIAKHAPIALAAMAAALIGVGAHAASPDPFAASVRVSLADLNLSSEPGADVALHRLHRAAASVCGPAPNVADLGRAAIYRECKRAAVERAVASLNSPLVTMLYTAGSRRSPELASR